MWARHSGWLWYQVPRSQSCLHCTPQPRSSFYYPPSSQGPVGDRFPDRSGNSQDGRTIGGELSETFLSQDIRLRKNVGAAIRRKGCTNPTGGGRSLMPRTAQTPPLGQLSTGAIRRGFQQEGWSVEMQGHSSSKFHLPERLCWMP